MSSHIVILALDRKTKKYRLLVLEKDPWCPRQDNQEHKKIEVEELQTSEIAMPPRPIEQLKSINLLTKVTKDD